MNSQMPGACRPVVLVAVVVMAAGLLNGLLFLTAQAAPEAELGPFTPVELPDDQQLDGPSGLLLIENHGQFDPRARFMMRHGLGQTWLADDGIWLSLYEGPASEVIGSDSPESNPAATFIVAANLKLSFVGANPRPVIEPTDLKTPRFSFFRGSDPSTWVRRARVWGQVRYRDLYPGIDLIVTAGPGVESRVLPWRLEVADGADLSVVRLRVEGPASLHLMDDQMRLETGAGEIMLPLLQVRNTSGGLLARNGALSAQAIERLGPYDYLIPRPYGTPAGGEGVAAASAEGLLYSTYLGGSSWDWPYGVAIDGAGAAYVVGVTPSPDFPTVTGSYRTTLNAQDAFVVKMNPDGSDLEYGTFLGGSGSDSGYAISVIDGQAYVTGSTWSADFPTTSGAYDTSCGSDGSCNGWTDSFLVRLNADGSDLVYATYLGGKDDDRAYAVDVAAGSIYVVGATRSSDFPTTSGAFDRECGSDGRCDPYQGNPTTDAFLIRLEPAGNGASDLLYGTYLGGGGDEDANDLSVSGGDAFITGQSDSFDFPASGYVGGNDAFVVRLDPAGNTSSDLIYGVFLGGGGSDSGSGIAASGSFASVTGETRSGDFPVTTGSYKGGFNDAFVARLDGSGNVTYAAFFGGLERDYGRDIVIDSSGAMIIVGYTQSLSDTFPITVDAYDQIQNGGRDVFAARILLESSQPEHITYASYLGGAQDDEVYGIAIDEQGRGFLIGHTKSMTDFPITTGSFQPAYGGGSLDGYVTKLQVGLPPGLKLEKHVNDLDADEPPGPYYYVGQPVTWTYVVSNTGLHLLTDVTIVDDQLGFICSTPSLAPEDDPLICFAHGTTEAGQYVNAATATGQPPPEFDPVSDVDLSHYFGATPEISLVKRTNGFDAADAPGPYIKMGEPITWTYQLDNNGNVPLTGIVVSDSLEGPVACETSVLAPHGSMPCIMTATAVSGQYANQGFVYALPPGGLDPLQGHDDSHYFGVEASISIEKRTNGQQADRPPGPFILAGGPVTWTYVVSNGSNVPLAAVSLLDDQLELVDCPDQIALGQSVSCEESGLAISGQYSNSVLVTGAAPGAIPVSATATSYYFGAEPKITINKLTNGADADTGPGPLIPLGDPVNWTYVVTNSGNITLTTIMVTDSEDIPLSCDEVSELGPGLALTCAGSGTAIEGQYGNIGTVIATPYFGPQVSDQDMSHYFGSSPSLSVVKRTNGQDAPLPPGPFIVKSGPVTWTYQVTNTGNITLSALSAVDDQLGPITCPLTSLGPGESMSCQKTGDADAGQYMNTVIVTGTPPVGDDVSGISVSHYFGVAAALSLTKMLNGQLVHGPPGPYVLAGDLVTWTYVVSNSGNVTVTQLSLVDDRLGIIDCPQQALGPGAGLACEKTEFVQDGYYSNTAIVSARPPAGADVNAKATSYYFGVQAGVRIEKATNGRDADEGPGPFILEGQPVTWTYALSNTGNITLTDILVTDSEGVDVSCPDTVLGLDQSFTCTGGSVAGRGQYSNTGIVSARPAFGPDVGDSDPSHYFGSSPGLAMVKLTNDRRAEQPPGPYILANDPVTWTYIVTNSGNVPLTSITVEDDQVDRIACPGDELGPGESMRCQASGVAIAGQYQNMATATGRPPVGPESTAGAISYYFGADTVLRLDKVTSGQVIAGAGPFIPEGAPVVWTYVVTNSGNVRLDNIAVWDDNGTAGDPADDFMACDIGSLAAGAQSTPCTVIGSAVAGPYSNVGHATGAPPDGLALVTDEDASQYFGASPAMAMQKLTDGQVADSPPGPNVIAGQPVLWRYRIANTGNITLTNVVISDDNGTPAISEDDLFVCEISDLGPGLVGWCEMSGTAIFGQYANNAEAIAKPLVGDNVMASAISHYYGWRGVFLPLLIK